MGLSLDALALYDPSDSLSPDTDITFSTLNITDITCTHFSPASKGHQLTQLLTKPNSFPMLMVIAMLEGIRADIEYN